MYFFIPNDPYVKYLLQQKYRYTTLGSGGGDPYRDHWV